MSNPYQSPQYAPAPSPFGSDGNRDKLRRVAKYQQWVIYALLVYILLYIGVISIQAAGFEALGALAPLLVLPVAIFAMVAIFLLAKELYNVGVAILCAALMIVPCISLITLLIVNGRATAFLKAQGVNVGFMGANPSSI